MTGHRGPRTLLPVTMWGPQDSALTSEVWCLLNAQHHQEGMVLSLTFQFGPKLLPSQGWAMRISAINRYESPAHSLHFPLVNGMIMHPPQLAALGPSEKDGTVWEPGLTFCNTPEETAMFSASSTVLVATVLTLVTTASLTALACSLVFSATGRGLWS